MKFREQTTLRTRNLLPKSVYPLTIALSIQRGYTEVAEFKAVMIKIIEESEAPGFGRWLEQAIAEDGRRIEEIAVAAKVSSSWLYQLRRGDRDKISREFLTRLEQALGSTYTPEEE